MKSRIGKLAGAGVLVGLAGLGTGTLAQTFPAPPEQWAEYEAAAVKTIVELQPYRRQQTAALASGETVALVNLNPNINATFLLTIGDGAFHIENPDPLGQEVALAEEPFADVLISSTAETTLCELWTGEPSAFRTARDSGLPYAPLCGGRLYLRNAIAGSRSSLETVTDFLRDHVWGGEEIVRAVKATLYKDKFAETSDLVAAEGDACAQDGPCPAKIEPKYSESAITPIGFGLALADPDQKTMAPGAWYPAAGLDGVFVSAIQPRTIASEIQKGGGNANRLDSIEGKAVAYMVAFDLDQYGIGFALGTDHPRLDWSGRPRAPARIKGLPGPDGIGDASPLVRSGMVSPDYAGRTVATFAAGFKRHHGAFKFGDYAVIDTGKHYGFIEKGVIYSKLKTELSTLYVLDDGTTGMKTWKDADDGLLPRIHFARQNGVPLVQTDPETGVPVPGDRVNQWGAGNWSGSAKAELRTLRAGGCLQEHQGRRYLIYGYFSTATPSALARTFQAYQCSYAMLLDMNAPELTYLALYPRQDGQVHVEHLTEIMAQFDKQSDDGTVIPKFLGYPDSRDLFFIYQLEAAE
ncbi:MAG: hypothetical protein QNJ44_15860 [Rhodobacter sp.]|nr:hypothetical protein [Rhodobacter sp.]